MANYKVFLSAGHGGSDPGAVGNGLKEKDINLQIMLSCKSELERHGVEVVCSRTKDENDPVTQEVAEANASKADVAVAFHTNAGGGHGSESYYYKTSVNGKRLAELCEKYIREIGQEAHGSNPVKDGSNLYFCRKTNMVGVLCECAYIDTDDITIVDTQAEQVMFGIYYDKSILEYFGIAYIVPNTSVSYVVKITADSLNVRSEPNANSKITAVVKKGYKYTIVEECNGWGKLKSQIGWIKLSYTERV